MFRMPGRQPRLNPDIIRVLWNLFPKSCHKSFCKIHDSDKNTSRNPRPADIVRHSAEAGNYGNPLPNPPRLFHIPRLERRRGFKETQLWRKEKNTEIIPFLGTDFGLLREIFSALFALPWYIFVGKRDEPAGLPSAISRRRTPATPKTNQINRPVTLAFARLMSSGVPSATIRPYRRSSPRSG